MREVGIRKLRNNLSREMKDLPFTVTSRGEEVAVVSVVVEGSHANIEAVVVEKEEKDLCKHNFPLGLCKKGCK